RSSARSARWSGLERTAWRSSRRACCSGVPAGREGVTAALRAMGPRLQLSTSSRNAAALAAARNSRREMPDPDPPTLSAAQDAQPADAQGGAGGEGQVAQHPYGGCALRLGSLARRVD